MYVVKSEYLPPPMICYRRCWFVCLSVSLLATLCKNFKTNFHEILREGWQWVSEQMFKFGGDADHCMDTEIVFGFDTIARYGKLDCMQLWRHDVTGPR